MSTFIKHTAVNKPQKAQLDAIHRLIRQNKCSEARAKLTLLRQRFPDFTPLLALAWKIETETETGTPWSIAARAFDWAQATPRSEAALAALEEAAFDLNLLGLTHTTRMRLAQLTGESTEQIPVSFETPSGSVSLEESALIDLSRILLVDGRYEEMIPHLKGATNSVLCNNRALAHFLTGDLTKASEEFEASWQQHPGNLFALKNVIRLRVWHRGNDYAAGLAAPMMSTVPQRSEHAVSKLQSLIWLHLWKEAENCWKSDSEGDYWPVTYTDEFRALFDYAGAVVALHNGNVPLTQERLRLALSSSAGLKQITALSQALYTNSDSGGYHVQIGEFNEWFPVPWSKRLFHVSRTRPADADKKLEQLFSDCLAHNDYLGLAAEFGGETVSNIASKILKQRAQNGDAGATKQLVSLLTCPFAPDTERMYLLSWLDEKKLVDNNAFPPMLINGEVKAVMPRRFFLTREATRESPYSGAAQKLYEKMVRLLEGKQLVQALKLAQEVRRQYPEAAMSHANVAMIMERLGSSPDEVEALLRHALALDENYIFARAGLARLLARRKDVAAAKALLEPVYAREAYHYSEWRIVLMAQREMAIAEGDDKLVQGINRSLRSLEDMAASKDDLV